MFLDYMDRVSAPSFFVPILVSDVFYMGPAANVRPHFNVCPCFFHSLTVGTDSMHTRRRVVGLTARVTTVTVFVGPGLPAV